MYVQVGDFHVSRGSPTVQLTQILHNAVFFKSQNPRKAGTLCIVLLYNFLMVSWKFQVIVCRHAKDYDETKGFAKIAVHLKLIQFFLSKLLQQ